MRRLLEAWDRHWFTATPLVRLGLFRIGILVLALWDATLYRGGVRLDAAMVDSGHPRTWSPIVLCEAFGLQPIGVQAADAVFAVLVVALVCGILGIGTRLACAVAVVLWMYWTALFYSFGKAHHDKVALAFALLALPLVPSGARVSLDAVLAAWRARRRGAVAPPPATHPFAGVPIRLTQLTIALGYMFAGCSKLVLGGVEWLNGYTLQGIMLGHDAWLSESFAQSRAMCLVMSAVLIVGQATFPLVLVWPRLAWVYLPLMTLFHLVSWYTLDTGSFMALWGTLIAFVPLDRVPAAVRARPPLGLVVLGALALVTWVLGTVWPWWLVALLPLAIACGWVRFSRPATL